MTDFVVKDSGKRENYNSGMMRDTQEGKADIDRVFDGPLVDRLAMHLTKGAVKYPDNADGTPNWTLASSQDELKRFRKSACRHFRQWMRGDQDEDHFAATVFNMNCYEYVRARLLQVQLDSNERSLELVRQIMREGEEAIERTIDAAMDDFITRGDV